MRMVKVMRELIKISKEILAALDNNVLQAGLRRSARNLVSATYNVINLWPYLTDLAKNVRKIKEKVLNNIHYYIDLAMRNIEKTSGFSYLAKTPHEVFKIIDDIIGEDNKLIVKSKSMVTEEIKIREHLLNKGHAIYETDLGELLIQLSGDKPMHTVAPAIHIPKEEVIKILNTAGMTINRNMSIEDIVFMVRRFLREKFVKADIGISGVNVLAADTGALFLVSNEGNIRLVTGLPPTHIAILGIEKLMPNMRNAFLQALVQAGYAGIYPPTYISIISGPSSTADIELTRVYGVHGPKKLYVIFYDGGRIAAIKNQYLSEQLYCIKCGRCQVECPIWCLTGNIWGGSVYGGPMGIPWTAITEDVKLASYLSIFCLGCGKCKKVCPMEIDMPKIIRYLKTKLFHKN